MKYVYFSLSTVLKGGTFPEMTVFNALKKQPHPDCWIDKAGTRAVTTSFPPRI